tara:strand:+ start:94 stop:510 length:417 start_codon:yes stop_codon:yes gene_type:complete
MSSREEKIQALEEKVGKLVDSFDKLTERVDAREMDFVPSELIDITEEPEYQKQQFKKRPKVEVELTDEGMAERLAPTKSQGCLVTTKFERSQPDGKRGRIKKEIEQIVDKRDSSEKLEDPVECTNERQMPMPLDYKNL